MNAAPVPKTVTTMTGAKDGASIRLRGRVSTIVWQHLTTSVAGKKLAYFDLAGGGEQTIVYWKEPPACVGDVEVTGRAIEVRGPSKRAHARETKVDDSYAELHVDVDSVHCVEGVNAK